MCVCFSAPALPFTKTWAGNGVCRLTFDEVEDGQVSRVNSGLNEKLLMSCYSR